MHSEGGLRERSGQKIIGRRQLPDLDVQRLHVDRRRSRLGLPFAAEVLGSPFQKLRPPRRDLVRVDVKLLGKLAQRLLTPDRGKRNFRLKSWDVVPRGRFVMLSPVHGRLRRVQAEFPLRPAVQISRASSQCWLTDAQFSKIAPHLLHVTRRERTSTTSR